MNIKKNSSTGSKSKKIAYSGKEPKFELYEYSSYYQSMNNQKPTIKEYGQYIDNKSGYTFERKNGKFTKKPLNPVELCQAMTKLGLPCSNTARLTQKGGMHVCGKHVHKKYQQQGAGIPEEMENLLSNEEYDVINWNTEHDMELQDKLDNYNFYYRFGDNDTLEFVYKLDDDIIVVSIIPEDDIWIVKEVSDTGKVFKSKAYNLNDIEDIITMKMPFRNIGKTI